MTTPPPTELAEAPPSRPQHGLWWRLGVLLLVVVLAVAVGRLLGLGRYTSASVLQDTVERLRDLAWIMPAFVAAFALGASIGLPASPFYLMGGALFGPLVGGLLTWIGATLGSIGSFLVARTLGHGALAHVVRRRVPDLHGLVAEHGFATVLRLRLIPVFPYNALNFGAGLAGMRLAPYALATALGIVPAVALYTFLGHTLAEGALEQGGFRRAVQVGAVIVVLSFVPTVVQRMRARGARRGTGDQGPGAG